MPFATSSVLYPPKNCFSRFLSFSWMASNLLGRAFNLRAMETGNLLLWLYDSMTQMQNGLIQKCRMKKVLICSSCCLSFSACFLSLLHTFFWGNPSRIQRGVGWSECKGRWVGSWGGGCNSKARKKHYSVLGHRTLRGLIDSLILSILFFPLRPC